ncbi:MAG: methyltransferase domain-containing protein [Chloroflexota bacterium]
MSPKKAKPPKSGGKSATGGVTQYYDAAAREYDAWFEGDGSLVFDTEVQALEALLPELPRSWLEVGIGSGRFALALGIDTGLDPSRGMSDIAKERGLKVILAKGEKLPFADASFGTVFLLFTLCFVESVGDVLKEACRVIQPGGRVVVGEVLKDSPYGRYYRDNKDNHPWYQFSNFCHYEDLESRLKETGFSVGKVLSTLFQKPREVFTREEPREGYDRDAGFTVIVGEKKTAK